MRRTTASCAAVEFLPLMTDELARPTFSFAFAWPGALSGDEQASSVAARTRGGMERRRRLFMQFALGGPNLLTKGRQAASTNREAARTETHTQCSRRCASVDRRKFTL